MNSNSGLVSIITPVYNAEAFLPVCIESVLNQTYENWELLLIDDASLDQSFSILKKYAAEDKRIKVCKLEQNSGAGIARNYGTKHAKGKYIAFLDADDLWKPHKLQVQVNLMEESGITVCFSSYALMDENGKKLPLLIEALPVLKYEKLLKSNYIGNLTGIYNVNKLGKFYAPEIRKRQDWAVWLQILKKTKKAAGIQQCLAYYRMRKGSISGNKLEMLKFNYKIYKEELNFSTLKSLWKMAIFLREHFFIKKKQLKKLK